MNTLKNMVVTGMLLVVAYGAYVVLQTGPAPTSTATDGESWDPTGDLTAPAVGLGSVEAMPDNAIPSLPGTPVSEPGPGAPGEIPAAGPGPFNPGNPLMTGLASNNNSNYPPAPGMEAEADRLSGSGAPASGDPALAANTAPNGSAPGAATAPNAGFEATWMAVEKSLVEDKLSQGLLELSMWHSTPGLTADQANRATQMLDQLAAAVIYSPNSYIEPVYTVQAGETLDQIAQRHNVSMEFLAKINGIAAPYSVAAGEQIKVLTGPFDAEISLSRSELTVFFGRYYAGRFPVEIGANVPQFDMDYVVAERSLGHSYFDQRAGREIPAGAPDNPFGKFWIGLRGPQITAANHMGLHSRGSGPSAVELAGVVLTDRDAEDLHAILSVGSQIRVRR